MSPRLIAGTAFLILANIAPAPAQEILDPALPQPQGEIVHDHSGEADLAISEDLEIFRRILYRGVSELYPADQARGDRSLCLPEPDRPGVFREVPLGAATTDFDNDGLVDVYITGTSRPIAEPLAAWIEGTGAVFQMEAPPPAPAPKKAKEPQTPERCPFMSKSQWERMRMELSGEVRKTDCTACHRAVHDRLGAHVGMRNIDCTECHDALRSHVSETGVLDIRLLDLHGIQQGLRQAPTREALTEQLVSLLAENGHHFRRLRPDESVTVGMTLRRLGRTTPAAVPQPPRESNPFQSESAPDEASTSSVEELAGDLQLRQQNWNRAAAIYSGELARLQREGRLRVTVGETPWEWRSVEVDPTYRDQVVRILRKVLQSRLGSVDLADARHVLHSLEILSSSDTGTRREHTTHPARLVVSARKSDLDAVASGKLSRDEFRKQVRVSWIEPQPPAAAPTLSEGSFDIGR